MTENTNNSLNWFRRALPFVIMPIGAALVLLAFRELWNGDRDLRMLALGGLGYLMFFLVIRYVGVSKDVSTDPTTAARPLYPRFYLSAQIGTIVALFVLIAAIGLIYHQVVVAKTCWRG